MKNFFHFIFLSFNLVLIYCSLNTIIKISSKNTAQTLTTYQFTLATYGYVPYGETITSGIKIAYPLNGCSPISTTTSDK